MEKSVKKMSSYNRQVRIFSRKFIHDFKKNSNFFTRFNYLAIGIFAFEFLACIFSIKYFSETSLIAFFLAVFLLTGFAYLILFFYFNTKKPDYFEYLKDRFIRSCRSNLPIAQGQIEHHLSICSAISFLVEDLKVLPGMKVFKKFSKEIAQEDIFLLKEMLLISSKQELLKQIKNTPVDIELHVALANNYVNLSALYKDHKQSLSINTKKEKTLDKKYSIAIQRTIEEFQILNDLSPNDPWVHAQLAKSYKELGLLEKEKNEYENILNLRPDDLQVMFQCAVCYFKLGQNAKGLKAYETLKKSHFIRADELLQFYGKENLKIEEEE